MGTQTDTEFSPSLVVGTPSGDWLGTLLRLLCVLVDDLLEDGEPIRARFTPHDGQRFIATITGRDGNSVHLEDGTFVDLEGIAGIEI